MNISYEEMRSLVFLGMGLYSALWVVIASTVIFVIHRKVGRK